MSLGTTADGYRALEELVVELRVSDAGLRARLTALLTAGPGWRVAAPGDVADLRLSAISVGAGHESADNDVASDGGVAPPLTSREHDVIGLLAEGLSNKAIGQRLGIAPDTAKFHVARILDKLDATGRTDAVAHAARRGIINL